jgi:hypothetical protein
MYPSLRKVVLMVRRFAEQSLEPGGVALKQPGTPSWFEGRLCRPPHHEGDWETGGALAQGFD